MSDIEPKKWTREDLIAAFVDGTDDQRQAMANTHGDITRHSGSQFDVSVNQWEVDRS